MNNLSCDVIRDLVPTYVDEICSADTKVIVEQHLQECEGCRSLVKMIKETEFVSEEINTKEIDYMKKIKKHLTIKSMICIGLLLCVAVAGIEMSVRNYGDVPLLFYYIIMPVWMAVAYLVSSDYTSTATNTGWKRLMTGVGCGLIIYTILLVFLVVPVAANNDFPFGIQPEQSGKLLYYQLLLLVIIQLASFVATWIISVRTSNAHIILNCITITGCCLALAFISMLRTLTEAENFIQIRNQSLVIILSEGMIMTGLLLYINKSMRKMV